MTATPPDGHAPRHWDLLSAGDKAVYLRICAALCAPSFRNRRNKRILDFKEVLDAIEVFENFNDGDRWKRCLVCGVCRMRHGLAVNVGQLKHIVFKCKSSINSSLKGLGYTVILAKTSLCSELLDALPYLRENPAELRKWTVRFLSCAPISERYPLTVLCMAEEPRSTESPPLPLFDSVTIDWSAI
jgi:hypothetical protein